MDEWLILWLTSSEVGDVVCGEPARVDGSLTGQVFRNSRLVVWGVVEHAERTCNYFSESDTFNSLEQTTEGQSEALSKTNGLS